MSLSRTEIIELVTVPGRFGIRSKTRRFFAYHYPTRDVAEWVAEKLESDWTEQVEHVNFSWPLPVMPAREIKFG